MPARPRVWRSRPIFISSTFRDMHAERDHLQEFVFPVLEERLRARGYRLEPVDLRWGIDTPSLETPHAKELLVLRVCVGEIERSRPFLVGIVGDRYGWVPPRERALAAAREAGLSMAVDGKSVTALELELGALSSDSERQRTFVYFREPLPYAEMDPVTAAAYSDAWSQDLNTRATHARLTELKARLRRELPGRVRDYRARWDNQAGSVGGLETWGQQVVEDLWQALDAETGEHAPLQPASWEEADRLRVTELIDWSNAAFVGCDPLLSNLEAFLTNPTVDGGTWGAALVGGSGSGKTSLFSALAGRLMARDVLLLTHAAGLGPEFQSVGRLLSRWTSELSTHLRLAVSLPPDAALAEKAETFRALLSEASQHDRVICLIDALDQFERTPSARHLTWLPRSWPENARLVVTSTQGAEADALRRRGVELIELPPITRRDAETILKALGERHHKVLHAELSRLLVEKPTRDGPPAAGSPLWLTLAFDALVLLDGDDFARAEREITGNSEAQNHRMLLEAAARMPPDVESLYQELLRRQEKLHGEHRAAAFSGLLAVSRSGLRESDLAILLTRETGEQVGALYLAALRRSFRQHLVQRGAFAQWDFAHPEIRRAIRRRLPGMDEAKRLHRIISEYLEGVPEEDGLRECELMFHYLGAEETLRAAQLYSSEISMAAEASATAALAAHAVGLGDAWCDWLSGLVRQPLALLPMRRLLVRIRSCLAPALADAGSLDEVYATAGVVRHRLLELLHEHPDDSSIGADLLQAIQVQGSAALALGRTDEALLAYDAGRALAEDLSRVEPDNVAFQRIMAGLLGDLAGVHARRGNGELALTLRRTSHAIFTRLTSDEDEDSAQLLALSHSGLGDVLLDHGDLAGSLAEYRAAQECLERLVRRHPSDTALIDDLCVAMNKLGMAYSKCGMPERAGELNRRVLALREDLFTRDPDHRAWRVRLAVAHNQLGCDLLLAGDVEGALSHHRTALDIRKGLVALDPLNDEWQNLLAASYGNLGDALAMRDDLENACVANDTCIRIRERLAARAPNDTGYQRALASSRCRAGGLHLLAGRGPEALECFCAAGEQLSLLARDDPRNTGLEHELSLTRHSVAMTLVGAGAGIDPRLELKALRLLKGLPTSASTMDDVLAIADAAVEELLPDRSKASSEPGAEMVETPQDGNAQETWRWQKARQHFTRGFALHRVDGERARHEHLAAIELTPTFVDPYLNVAGTYYDERRLTEAIEWWRKGLALAEEQRGLGDHPSPVAAADVARAYFDLGGALLMSGRPSEARDAYRSVLDWHPNHPGATHNLIHLSTAQPELFPGGAGARGNRG
jgi:tetratricopeptide (TPR) repeat protein